MASGWAELLKEVQRQTAMGGVEAALLWSKFEEVSTTSARPGAMNLARSLGAELSPNQRAQLAVLVASLLEPIEWPPEWEQARGPLVTALEELSRQADPENSESLAAALGLTGEPLCEISFTILHFAKVVLSRPCPRGELPYVASFVTLGNYVCFLAFGLKLRKPSSTGNRDAIQPTVTRFSVVFQRYAQAARAMNAACGEVLFDGLDARLEGS